MSASGSRLRSFAIEPHGSAFFGPRAVQRLPELVHAIGAETAFIVTDRGLIAAGVCATVEHCLHNAEIETATFADIRPNPNTDDLDAGANAIRQRVNEHASPDHNDDPCTDSADSRVVVIAVGGGAVMDAAKGLALMAVNDGSARDFEYHREPQTPGLPLIALPTTAGTGSETNPWGVIDDPAAGRKFYIGHASVRPRHVILDPELALTLPPLPTAAAGADALAHSLESLSSIRSNPYAEALNREAVRLAARALPVAVADGSDITVRGELLLAAHLAGLAFATTGLGLAHAVAHSLSARIGAAHGVALAILLPHVLAFNLPVCRGTYANLAPVLGADIPGPRAEDSIEVVRRLTMSLGLPSRLRDLGLSEQQIAQVVEDALIDDVLANTPRQPTARELDALLHEAL